MNLMAKKTFYFLGTRIKEFRAQNFPRVLAEATADIAFAIILCVTWRIAESFFIVKKTSKYHD